MDKNETICAISESVLKRLIQGEDVIFHISPAEVNEKEKIDTVILKSPFPGKFLTYEQYAKLVNELEYYKNRANDLGKKYDQINQILINQKTAKKDEK